MTRQRLYFFLVLCVLACAWATSALFTQFTRFAHRDLILALRGAESAKLSAPDEAIADYKRALAIAPCNAALHREHILLLAYQEALAMTAPDIERADIAAEATQSALGALLACTPMDGKAWLDFAMLDIHRVGASHRAFEAYAMSAAVSPRESWLAKKRLLFALKFQPVFDAKAKAVARDDLSTLEHAHGIHFKQLLQANRIATLPELYDLFAASAQ